MHDLDNSRYYKRTVVKDELFSVNLGTARPIRVFLPPGFQETVTYPVIYCQDGEHFFNYGRIATHATKLILEESAEPMIIVGVDVDMPNRTAEYSPDGERFDAYLSFFVDELLPYVEGKYPLRTSPEDRVVAGDSLGGTVSLHLALEYPDLFRNVLSLSGAFLEPTQSFIRHYEQLHWLHMYQLIGLQEEQVKTDRGTFDFVKANRSVRELLDSRNAKLRYREQPGEHIWGFWQQHLPDALRYFFA